MTWLGPQTHDNFGVDAADRPGAMNSVGAVDYRAGVAGGEYLGKAGKKSGVCINSLPGAANIEDYCNGFAKGSTGTGGAGSGLPLPATAQGHVTAVAPVSAPTCWKTPTSTRSLPRHTLTRPARCKASRRRARPKQSDRAASPSTKRS